MKIKIYTTHGARNEIVDLLILNPDDLKSERLEKIILSNCRKELDAIYNNYHQSCVDAIDKDDNVLYSWIYDGFDSSMVRIIKKNSKGE